MKLHEFLKQFEGLDPELEIYAQHNNHNLLVYKTNLKPHIKFVDTTNCLVHYSSIEKSDFCDKKAIVLY